MSAAQDRLDRLFGTVRRRTRDLATPEGIALPVEVAGRGERLVAFFLDLTFCLLATAFCYVAIVALLLSGTFSEAAITLLLLVAFILRNCYFIWFELNWNGATPGKRIARIRVIDRAGGTLTPMAVVARNLTRELEVFIPISVLLTLGSEGGASGFERLAFLAWLLLLSGLPLFNRDHLRIGDFVAGTMVIGVPSRVLLPDLVAARSRFAFTQKQLAAYGTFELQVLEEVLRRPPGPDTSALLEEIAGKVARKIAWTAPLGRTEASEFLQAFYTAERSWLEREQLFGRRHADKHEAAAAASADRRSRKERDPREPD